MTTCSIPNIVGFVAATIGHSGKILKNNDVVCVRSPIPVPNSYINAGFVLHQNESPSVSIAQMKEFFGETKSPFVLWVPAENKELAKASELAGGILDQVATPDMQISAPIEFASRFEMQVVTDAEEFAVCALVCEEGYGFAGMAWLMEQHKMFEAPNVSWVVAWEQGEPVGAGCAFQDGETAGIYYIATPARSSRRGVATSVTSWLTNQMMKQGATTVALQSSSAGLPVYQRLGFRTMGLLTRYSFE